MPPISPVKNPKLNYLKRICAIELILSEDQKTKTMKFKTRVRKVLLGLAALFVAMFILRMLFGYSGEARESYSETQITTLNFAGGSSNNIASTRYKIKKGGTSNAQVVSVDQKYEKTADFSCKTDQFEAEEKQINQIIESNNAIIQFQQKSGVEGSRLLYLQIGVQPEKFEAVIAQIQEQITVRSLNVTKKDKTNEYRELNAKTNTLKATRQALVDLKNKGGKIEEYIDLENRILEIDEQLQQLGVQLGSFDSENEFVTVNVTLREGELAQPSFGSRIRMALEWTIEYYLMLMIAFCGAVIGAYLLVVIVDKLKIITKVRE